MICLNQSNIYTKKYQAKETDLEKISFSIGDGHFPGLSNRSSAVLRLMVSLSRMGHTGITACADSIIRAISRGGYRMSERTFYRALNELQTNGFFARSKYRVGADKFGTNIIFVESRFEFWKRKKEVIHEPTVDHFHPCLPNWQEDTGTKIDHRVTPNSSVKVQIKPRTRAGKFKNWIHPVLYSLMVILQRQKVKDRALLISRAKFEIEAERKGIEVCGHSGAEWDRPHWQEMPHTHREKIIRDEILPLLRNTDTLQSNNIAEVVMSLVAENQAVTNYQEYCPPPAPMPIPPAPRAASPMVLTPEEMKELESLKASIGRCRILG